MKYKVVMGYYPSYNSADKVMERANNILKSIKSKIKASVIKDTDCFIVLLYETENYNDADNVFSECMKNRIYCGIDISEKKCTE